MLIYLAIPYSHPDPAIRQLRHDQVTAVATRLMTSGYLIFSPISHSHHMAVAHTTPTDWEFWERHCLAMLAACSKLIVLKLDGWETSRGVMAEMQFAETTGIEIEFMEFAE